LVLKDSKSSVSQKKWEKEQRKGGNRYPGKKAETERGLFNQLQSGGHKPRKGIERKLLGENLEKDHTPTVQGK